MVIFWNCTFDIIRRNQMLIQMIGKLRPIDFEPCNRLPDDATAWSIRQVSL